MTLASIKRAALALVALTWAGAAPAQDEPYAFNVLNQRSIAITSQYWNPILAWVSAKSGVPLELKLARTTKEANTLAEQGAYPFIYTNHFFTPERDRLGFHVIARPAGPGIRAQIAVRADSSIRTVQDLNGREVAFANPDAFAAYWLPMDELLKGRIAVKPVFTASQEAGLAQLKVGTIAAVGASDKSIRHYSRREGFEYRLLWKSDMYNDLAIMTSPKVPAAKAAAVRNALIGMVNEPAGRKVLEASAALVKADREELGFVAAVDGDYDNYRAFYRKTLVKTLN